MKHKIKKEISLIKEIVITLSQAFIDCYHDRPETLKDALQLLIKPKLQELRDLSKK